MLPEGHDGPVCKGYTRGGKLLRVWQAELDANGDRVKAYIQGRPRLVYPYVEPTKEQHDAGMVTACRNCERFWLISDMPRWPKSKWCRPCTNERARNARTPEQIREAHLKRNYGITHAEAQAILESQGGCCAICREPLAYEDAHVDHDHERGVVRGLLDVSCNNGLGCFRDVPDRLRKAAAYLEANVARHGEKSDAG